MSPTSQFDRQAVIGEFTQAGTELRQLLASLSPADLRARSTGTRWTNEQLLFHMVFGYLIVRTLLPLVKIMSRTPPLVGRAFARALDATTVPFDAVNYWGSCLGALVYRPRRLARKYDRVAASILRQLERESEASLRREMFFPTRWDPFFKPVMTIADVYRYPLQHFEFHRAQLSRIAVG
jgi:DinB superfamily